MLLHAAWWAVKALDYRANITYTLTEEGGASLSHALPASGAQFLLPTKRRRSLLSC